MVIVSLFRDGFSAVVLTEDAYAVCFTVVVFSTEPNGNRHPASHLHTSHDMHPGVGRSII